MAEEKEVTTEPNEREKLYQSYQETNGLSVEAETPVVEPEAAEQPPVEAEEPKVDTKTESEKAQEKFVPKAALDEERAKRKREREAREALEAKLAEYERSSAPEDAEPIYDYDNEIKALKRRLALFEMTDARREELARQEAARQGVERVKNMIASVDEDLAKEGFGGFRYMVGAVSERLQQMAAEDPDIAEAYNNPAGWKKIFKEEVFPEFNKSYETARKTATLDEKKRLKEEANLATTTGTKPVKKETDDPETWSEERRREEYMKTRRQASLS